jgi:hypothetical protein
MTTRNMRASSIHPPPPPLTQGDVTPVVEKKGQRGWE